MIQNYWPQDRTFAILQICRTTHFSNSKKFGVNNKLKKWRCSFRLNYNSAVQQFPERSRTAKELKIFLQQLQASKVTFIKDVSLERLKKNGCS